MRRYLALAILPALIFAPTALAGTVAVGTQTTGNRYDPYIPAVLFTAVTGERNQIEVARDRATGDTVLRDSGAPLQAGTGCTAIDASTARCPVPSIVIDTGDGDDSVTVLFEASLGHAVEVRGGEGNDTISGFGQLSGGPGADKLTGSPLQDTLLGGTGDDVLRGGGGDDRLVGDGDGAAKASPDPGGGDDTLDGGAGRDMVLYIGRRTGVRVDLAAGTAGARSETSDERDRLRAVEDVTGGLAADVLLGDAGPNELEGHPGDDRLDGRAGNDSITGGQGADTLRGGAGNDRLNTHERHDRLFGGAGDDTLQASYKPANLLRCGSGSDTIDGAPQGQRLVDCERVRQYGLTMSVRPQRRAGGALRFTWSCSHRAADVNPGCLLTVTVGLGSKLLARRKVTLASPSSGSFVLRPSRPIRRAVPIDVAISGGNGTRTKVGIPINARWSVRL